MRKTTENSRANAEYFSPRSKGKDLAVQQPFVPSYSTFHQETPMRPSQVPNRLSHPPPRRVLPLESPELCHRDRLGQSWRPSHNPGAIHPSVFVPSTPASSGTPVSRSYHIPRDRPGLPQHCAQPDVFPLSSTKVDTLANWPQHSSTHVFHNTSLQFMRELSNHSLYSHIGKAQVKKPKDTFFFSGSNTVTAKCEDLNKTQSSDAQSSMRTIQLHRPPLTPSLNSRATQQLYPRPLSQSEQWSSGTNQWPLQGYQASPTTQSSDTSSGPSLFIMQSPVAPGQDQEHKPTPSSNMLIPVVDLNYSSPKRRRDVEHCDDGAKKLCVETVNSERTQVPKPTDGNSLSTSQVPSSNHSSVLELSHGTTDHLCTESAFGRSSSKLNQSSCTAKSPKTFLKGRPPMGAKQIFINSSQNHIVKLSSTSLPSQDNLKNKCEENHKTVKPSTLSSPEIPQKDTNRSPYTVSENHHSGQTHCGTTALHVNILSKGKQLEERRKSDSSTYKPASKQNSSSLSRCIVRKKTAHPRRPVIPDDADELFTPDPMVYVVSPARKTGKPNIDGQTVKSPISEKSFSSTTATSSSTPVTGSLCHKTQNSTVTGSSHAVDTKVSFSACNQQILLPTITLVRVKPALKSTENINSKDGDLNNTPLTTSGRQLKEKSVKPDEKPTSPLTDNVSSHTLETDTAASKQTSSLGSVSLPLKRQVNEGGRKQVDEEDPIDVELGLSLALDLDLTQSSQSSEEEPLLSFQEMMERVTKPPDTPEKRTYSESSTLGRNCQTKIHLLPSSTNTGIYRNSLDQMLKDINTNKRAKEIEMQLLTACKEDLLRIAEYEEAEENQNEGISTEQQEFLQRYSLMSSAIREVPPGETVFNLDKFGQIFNQNSLQLRKCMVNPQGTAQKTLLWSSPAQLKLHVTIGLFQESYDCQSPCPSQVTRFLFKMMSVHSERMVSDAMLKALCDIACTAAYQRVKNGNQQFKVWVPSLADVTLVLMNMGVAFVTLFPFENLQPAFTEGDLLEEEHVKIETPSSDKEQNTFPEHNCNNILKYLSYCMGLCPRAYSDGELLLLLTVVARIGLDTRLILQSDVELYPLQFKMVNNIRDWDTMLPRICQALTNMTDDHHNMCLLVQMLPDNTCGRQLRRHLSLSMISKLLDGNCIYRPTEKEFQLSKLRPYLARMKPSALLRTMLSSSSRSEKDEDDMAALDQQAYYLCYSLLTLANESSNFQFFPAEQKEQLMYLCSELETHVKCDIRESEKRLYRSKVKDLVARIYTKWQMLLQRTRPLHGKLYDYWQPLPADTLICSQDEQVVNSDDAEGTVMEEGSEPEEDEQEETSGSEENEVEIKEDQKEEEGLEEQGDKKSNDKLGTGGGSPVVDPNEREDGMDHALGELNQQTVELEPQGHTESKGREEKMDASNAEHTEMETDNTEHAELGTSPQPVCTM
ncbi:hypothetical protein Q5P01_021477 [Channa striata]|uniref:Coiled-coil SMC6 And NSE5 INteracting (CANIN) domain-containing protein n=1 Tax=Channa striata TaxID=64152 RepID=A0AA88S0F9_CHASR|nr:hypothetical protein Q5P01_021477 [Channa striata]